MSGDLPQIWLKPSLCQSSPPWLPLLTSLFESPFSYTPYSLLTVTHNDPYLWFCSLSSSCNCWCCTCQYQLTFNPSAHNPRRSAPVYEDSYWMMTSLWWGFFQSFFMNMSHWFSPLDEDPDNHEDHGSNATWSWSKGVVCYPLGSILGIWEWPGWA
jgi:hypothetical protein